MKKSELKTVIKEEIKKILNEGISSRNEKQQLIDYLDAYIEDYSEHASDDLDPYSDEFDYFFQELSKLVGVLKRTVKSYTFKSIK